MILQVGVDCRVETVDLTPQESISRISSGSSTSINSNDRTSHGGKRALLMINSCLKTFNTKRGQVKTCNSKERMPCLAFYF